MSDSDTESPRCPKVKVQKEGVEIREGATLLGGMLGSEMTGSGLAGSATIKRPPSHEAEESKGTGRLPRNAKQLPVGSASSGLDDGALESSRLLTGPKPTPIRTDGDSIGSKTGASNIYEVHTAGKTLRDMLKDMYQICTSGVPTDCVSSQIDMDDDDDDDDADADADSDADESIDYSQRDNAWFATMHDRKSLQVPAKVCRENRTQASTEESVSDRLSSSEWNGLDVSVWGNTDHQFIQTDLPDSVSNALRRGETSYARFISASELDIGNTIADHLGALADRRVIRLKRTGRDWCEFEQRGTPKISIEGYLDFSPVENAGRLSTFVSSTARANSSTQNSVPCTMKLGLGINLRKLEDPR